MYVNGVDAEPSFNGTWDSDYSTASFPGAFVGGSPTQDGQDPLYADGYLSDLYVVEQALDPEAFGKSFEGKWGPLDSSDVYDNIANSVEVPPGEDWNTSQVWSENSSGNLFNNDPVSLAFDGNLSTQITSGTVDCVIDLGEVPGTKFELYGGSGESHSLGLQPYILVNGTQATLGSVLENDWGDVTSLITDGKLNTITLSASANNLYANLGAVRVDGKILVDGGSFGANGFHLPFDPEAEGVTGQTWSDDVDTESFTVEANRGPDKGFDGDLSTSCAVNANNDVYYISLKDDWCWWIQKVAGLSSTEKSQIDGGTFGANGFHLPFDPAATGAIYRKCCNRLVMGIQLTLHAIF